MSSRRYRPEHNQSRPRSAASGFTLIELLVVIAMIALLGALLLPALARAKEKGKQTYRISSERQQAMAVFMYVEEFLLRVVRL